MKSYNEIEAEVNETCAQHPNCWKSPAVDCPYGTVCWSFQDDAYKTAEQRSAAFESAIAARYDELHR